MPYHELPRDATTSDRIAVIQRTERIVSVVPAGDGALLVITEAKEQRRAPGSKEQRA